MTVGPTVWPSRRDLDAVRVRATRPASRPRASTSALLIVCAAERVRYVGRRQRPLAALRARTELELGLLGSSADVGGGSVLRRAAASAWRGVVVAGGVVERRWRQRRRAASGSTCRTRRCAVAVAAAASTCRRAPGGALRPTGHGDRADAACRVVPNSVRSDDAGDQQHAADARAATSTTIGAAGGDQASAAARRRARRASRRRVPSVVEVADDLARTADDVQQAEARPGPSAPADDRGGTRCSLRPLRIKATPTTTRAIGHDEAAEAGEPADQRLDRRGRASRPGRGRWPRPSSTPTAMRRCRRTRPRDRRPPRAARPWPGCRGADRGSWRRWSPRPRGRRLAAGARPAAVRGLAVTTSTGACGRSSRRADASADDGAGHGSRTSGRAPGADQRRRGSAPGRPRRLRGTGATVPDRSAPVAGDDLGAASTGPARRGPRRRHADASPIQLGSTD